MLRKTVEKQATLDQLLDRYEQQALSSKKGFSVAKLAGFTAAAGAAMTLTTAADAALVYSGPVALTAGASTGTKLVDFNSDGQMDFSFRVSSDSLGQEAKGSILDGSFQGSTSWPLSTQASGIPVVGGGHAFEVFFNISVTQGLLSSTGFFGFQFTGTGGGSYLGWMQLAAAGPSDTLTLIDFAYNDTHLGAINVGQVPEPSSLALLATGAMGLAVYRRGRRRAKKADKA